MNAVRLEHPFDNYCIEISCWYGPPNSVIYRSHQNKQTQSADPPTVQIMIIDCGIFMALILVCQASATEQSLAIMWGSCKLKAPRVFVKLFLPQFIKHEQSIEASQSSQSSSALLMLAA